MPARSDLLRGPRYGRGHVGTQELKSAVHPRRRGLDEPEGADEWTRHAYSADRKVLHRALSLRAVKRILGNKNLAHTVFLGSGALAHSNFL